jgi:hypothetical protein
MQSAAKANVVHKAGLKLLARFGQLDHDIESSYVRLSI